MKHTYLIWTNPNNYIIKKNINYLMKQPLPLYLSFSFQITLLAQNKLIKWMSSASLATLETRLDKIFVWTHICSIVHVHFQYFISSNPLTFTHLMFLPIIMLFFITTIKLNLSTQNQKDILDFFFTDVTYTSTSKWWFLVIPFI